jgi:integrase
MNKAFQHIVNRVKQANGQLKLGKVGVKIKINSGRLRLRDLPSDAEIAKHRSLLVDDPEALWVYGMMATYGLRNHEIFHLDLSNIEEDGQIQVLNRTKSGSRKVWPCFPEWVEMWNLGDPFVPKMRRDIDSYRNSYLGDKIYRLLEPIPFAPYNLRHAWVRRIFEYG